ncbi:E3 ubiquitin-protein ligase TRIM45-like [Penaeus indicus]|uniref:E3 ubiquitin-protein ligase TRIM45-like n=1 Tax=Penaeus indicus TaxID=29960 RepID=UPI00300D5238
MSECGACGRRWVEPRLLPCLHTVCTPCLHSRAALIAPTAVATRTASSCHGSAQSAPASASGSLDSGSGRTSQERAPAGCSTATSSATSNSPAVASAPAASPILVSSMSASPLYSSRPTKVTLTSTITYNGGNLSRHWDGESSSAHLSLASGSGSSREEGVASSSSARASPHATHVLNGTAGHPEDHHHQLAQDSDQQSQWGAPDDLDSVIELLTNLSPNCSNNNYNSSHTPKQTATPTPGEGETHTKAAPSLLDEEVGSPSSTIDSRSSSRTRSSGRSSGSESGLRDRGVWVVWCPECGYEAHVPPGGVECFPLNYVLQKQLVLEALNSSSTTVYCDLCHDDVVAEERCNTCPVNLCRLCSHAHTRQRRTTHHAVISLQEARSLGIREVAHTLVCATHGEGEVGWWCRSCHEPLCAACLATLHRGHPTLTVDQEAPQARRNLTTLLDQASTRMDDLLSTVEELTGAAARVQQRGKAVGDQVNAFIDDYILALEEHRHALLRQVRQACERAQRGIVTESQRAGQIASWLRQGCDLTHDLLNHAGDAEALALAPLVTHRLQALLAEQVRGWTRWERLALLREHRAGRVRGHKIHGVIADAPADPATSRLKPLCDVSSVAAGARVTALVVARDADGQPITHGGEDLHAAVLTRDGNALCGCSVRDREDGSYEITFSPPVPSAALLHVTILGFHIQGSPMEMTVVSHCQSASTSAGDASRDGASGRRHTGVFHCCTFCSSGGDKTATCACGATMPGGYQGCGHSHAGHPGRKHWSCCAQANPSSPCTRPPSQYYQVTL